MSFDLRPAAAADAPAITAVFLAAFSDPFNHRLFPRTPDVSAYWDKQFAHMVTNPAQRVLKIVKTDAAADTATATTTTTATATEDIVAFAVWDLPSQSQTHANSTPETESKPENYPASADAELCRLFFGGMEMMHEKIMHGRPHYYLNMLGTHPEFNGKGLGSRLLRWGLERADAEGVETYLSASPKGRPLYEKYGFRVVVEREVAAGYMQAYMVRGVGGRSGNGF